MYEGQNPPQPDQDEAQQKAQEVQYHYDKRRGSVISTEYWSVVDKVNQADIQALNGELSVDSIRQGFVEAGMTEDEAQQKAQEVQYHYDERRKELKEEQN